jgi:hypothetical protein
VTERVTLSLSEALLMMRNKLNYQTISIRYGFSSEAQVVRECTAPYDHEGSLPCLQEPTFGRYPGSNEPTSQPLNLFL